MNIDLTCAIGICKWYIKFTMLEFDADKIWGFSFGCCRLIFEYKNLDASIEKSLFLITKAKYLTKLDILFITIYRNYKVK